MDPSTFQVLLPRFNKPLCASTEEGKAWNTHLLNLLPKDPKHLKDVLLRCYSILLMRYCSQGTLAIQVSSTECIVLEIEPNQTFSEIRIKKTVPAKSNVSFGRLPDVELSFFYDEKKCGFQSPSKSFPSDFLARMVLNFQALLERLLTKGDTPIGEISCLDKSEESLILQMSQGEKKPFPDRDTLSECFEKAAKKWATRPALSCAGKIVTYQELNEKANQLARYLQSQGLKEEDRVALLMYRSIDFVVSMLAIFKMGAICTPVDPSYPQERKLFMIQTASCQHILTTTQEKLSIDSLHLWTFCLDQEQTLSEQMPSANLDHTLESDLPAFVLFTSGSTGTPKGILLNHQGFVALINRGLGYNICPEDRVLQTSGVSFDAIQLETWASLLQGALVCINPQKKIAADSIAELIKKEKITHAFFTASIFNLSLEYHIDALKDLKYLSSCGEAMSVHYAKKGAELLSSTQIYNEYGPSEHSVISTNYRIDDLAEIESGIPIGRPLPNKSVYVLHDSFQLAPIGVVGELFCGGVGVALGYINRPDLTAEKFTNNPFEKGRLYRTGDLGRYLPNGQIELIGRIDNQVKISGYRIELDEIAFLLENHPKVNQAVVLLLEKTPGNKRLYAYVEKGANVGLTPTELKKYLQTKLPQAVIPHMIVILDQFPMNPNGKVDKQALSLYQEEREPISERERITGDIEKEVANTWSHVLQMEELRKTDDFFLSGGSSIIAAEMTAILHDQWHAPIPIELIFEEPILENYAARIREIIELEQKPKHVTTADLFWIWRNRELLLEPFPLSKLPAERQFHSPKHILLTGASGFFGAFMLDELLRTTKAEIHCLIRAQNRDEGQKRIESILKQYRIQAPNLDRIRVVIGDLELPSLGLNSDEMDSLASTLDAIFHVGAYVNHVLPFDQLKKSNVLGTYELLQLAMNKKSKVFHFISTIDVLETTRSRIVEETTDLEKERLIQTGYGQSKWVAEKLVMTARNQGLATSIYRMGRIHNHSQTGAGNKEDFFWKMVQTSLFLKMAPDLALKEGFAPVDTCCQMISQLAKDPNAIHQEYHVVSPLQLTYRSLFQKIENLGYRLSLVPYATWLKTLRENDSNDTLKRSYSLFSVLGQDPHTPQIQYGVKNLETALHQSPLPFPPFDEIQLKQCFAYFKSIGYWL